MHDPKRFFTADPKRVNKSAVTRKKFNTHSSLRSSKRRKGLWIEKKGKREGIGKRG